MEIKKEKENKKSKHTANKKTIKHVLDSNKEYGTREGRINSKSIYQNA